MKNLNYRKVKGYIEGYYGKLLTWDERMEILDVLSKNNMNFYFYCPKEDVSQRFRWKEKHTNKWLKNFTKLNTYASERNINVIAGISPGLDFNFKSYVNGNKEEFYLLLKKFKTFLSCGVNHVAILFDDIPNEFKLFVKSHAEGEVHARIINETVKELSTPIFAVPRIYSDELNVENKNYLTDFFKTVNKNVQVFFTGKYIVSKNFSSNKQIILQKIKENKIVNWDNYYANDYCPKKLFIGPWENKNLIEKSMINGTGMIETDKLILEIVSNTAIKNNFLLWQEILIKHNIPDVFFNICHHFLKPSFTFERKIKTPKYSENTYKSLDILLWQWKTKISREWYPYLLNLKHDLQIFDKSLSLNRVLKTQTIPIQNVLKYRRNLK